MSDQEPTKVYARLPDTQCGEIVSVTARYCGVESCRGEVLCVRWASRPEDYPAAMKNLPRHRYTYPCTGGMTIRPDGQWQIT